jgi:hypothetical protein
MKKKSLIHTIFFTHTFKLLAINFKIAYERTLPHS